MTTLRGTGGCLAGGIAPAGGQPPGARQGEVGKLFAVLSIGFYTTTEFMSVRRFRLSLLSGADTFVETDYLDHLACLQAVTHPPYLVTFVTVIKMEIVPKTREEIRIAAGLIGIRFNTVPQWFHCGAIPPLAELQLIEYFGHHFFVVDYPIKTSGRPCLAHLARKYIR